MLELFSTFLIAPVGTDIALLAVMTGIIKNITKHTICRVYLTSPPCGDVNLLTTHTGSLYCYTLTVVCITTWPMCWSRHDVSVTVGSRRRLSSTD